jgi:small ligand-binding sensory domain FIST
MVQGIRASARLGSHVKTGAGLSLDEDARRAATEAASAASDALDGSGADLAVVFASAGHAASAEDVLEAVHDVAGPGGLIGCLAEAVVGGPLEVEGRPAVSVWLGSFPGDVETFHMGFARTESGGAFHGWRFQSNASEGAPVHLLICDPFTFPADLLLQHLNDDLPGSLVIGGNASGAELGRGTILFHDRSIRREGAVGARLPATVASRMLVSQGCRPIGQAFVVTRAEGNVIHELGGHPPLERLRETVSALGPPDRELISHGLHLGRVIDEYRPEHGMGDFLIRGVLGADPQTGAMAVGDHLEVGQTVRFHVRDAATADEELRYMLDREVRELRGRPSGALLFTCNGRGTRLFPAPNHDAELVSSYLGGAPLAGFFCAGELGPVGGKNFLHGFTASLAIFLDEPGEPPSPTPS